MSGAVPKGAAPDCCGGSEGYRSEKVPFLWRLGLRILQTKLPVGNLNGERLMLQRQHMSRVSVVKKGGGRVSQKYRVTEGCKKRRWGYRRGVE